MIEARERAYGIAKPRAPSLKRTGYDNSHLLRVARHACGMCIACTKHLLHPCMIWAAGRLNTRRAFPDLSAIRAGLYENDLDPKGLKLIGDGLGPSFDRPFSSTIDRFCGLSHESSLTRDNDDPAPPLRPEGRQDHARQPEHTEEIRLHHPPKL